MGCCCENVDPEPPSSIRGPKADPGSQIEIEPRQRSQWEKLVDWLRWWWQGDNDPCDFERCDNEHGDNEQSNGDLIYEQKVQMLVEMGFAEDDVRRALNENDCNVLLALLMLCVQNTNTEA
ncbi:uncharacterized protein LOC142630308 [Castanea sativa]|uniref:uncharacterized protein LOC142630308 n=1 Tax=Castanea sativa TaxID=21020 RepID=UPI003F64E105